MKPGVSLARHSRFCSKKIKVLLDFFLWGNLPPVCLRVSPGLLRHSCGPASCHTSSMAAKLGLALTQNSSPTPLANRRCVAQIAVSKGRAFGRASQGAKFPPAAAGETPAGRSQRNTLASQTAIRRWRNPRPRAMDPAAAPCGGGRRGPYAITAPGHCRSTHRRRDTSVPPYIPCRQSVRVRRAAPVCAAAGRHFPFFEC